MYFLVLIVQRSFSRRKVIVMTLLLFQDTACTVVPVHHYFMSVLEILYSIDGQRGREVVAFHSRDAIDAVAREVQCKIGALGLSDLSEAVYAEICRVTHQQLLRFTCQCSQGRNEVSISILQPFQSVSGSRHSSGGWGGG